MGNTKAIPEGYMTVGEIAKKMKTTVRTLQYYDNIGLFSPSGQSEGGRRLYTQKDLIKLHQIMSMKYLGFSLEKIKSEIIPLENSDEVVKALSQQALATKEKISELKKVLADIEALKKEVMQINTVDFKRYADIISILQDGNEFFWIIKHFDDEMLTHISTKIDEQKGKEIIDTWKELCIETADLIDNGVSPDSDKGISMACRWWDMVMKFTGGDMSLVPSLQKFDQKKEGWDKEWKEKQEYIDAFIEKALEAYFIASGNNPFVEVTE